MREDEEELRSEEMNSINEEKMEGKRIDQSPGWVNGRNEGDNGEFNRGQ